VSFGAGEGEVGDECGRGVIVKGGLGDLDVLGADADGDLRAGAGRAVGVGCQDRERPPD